MSPRGRVFASALLLLGAARAWGPGPARAQQPDSEPESEDVSIQRYLAHLYLGDSLDDVQRVYPPAQEWPISVEPRSGVRRMKLEKETVKDMPRHAETMWLGMKRDKLVEVQVIYDADYTHKKSAEALAGDFALIYGEPHRTEGRFWWTDGTTVLRVFYAEVPIFRDGAKGVELHTSIQLMEESLFRRRG